MAGLAPGDLVGPYVIEERQGDGATATVYRAHHPVLGTLHALKLVHPGSYGPAPPSLLHRLLAFEGKLQATVAHPNVVRLVEIQSHEGAPALVLEYVDGQTLEQLLERGPLPIALVDTLARDLLEGLRAIHEAGIVHRDLKPANVLIVEQGESCTAKIGDFGVARPLQLPAELAGAPGPLGTPRYMAPEQYRDARLSDARSDLFSLGCLLYEMLTGKPAFPGEDLVDLRARITSGEVVPVRILRSGVPARMLNVVERCLKADPDQRPADCRSALSLWSGADRQPKTVPAPPLADQTTMPGARPREAGPAVLPPGPRLRPPSRYRRRGSRMGLAALVASFVVVLGLPFAMGFGLIALAAGQPSLPPLLKSSARAAPTVGIASELRVEPELILIEPEPPEPAPRRRARKPEPVPEEVPLISKRSARPPPP